jgi:hypothetical protein
MAMSDELRNIIYNASAKINTAFKAIPTKVNNPSPNTYEYIYHYFGTQ